MHYVGYILNFFADYVHTAGNKEYRADDAADKDKCKDNTKDQPAKTGDYNKSHCLFRIFDNTGNGSCSAFSVFGYSRVYMREYCGYCCVQFGIGLSGNDFIEALPFFQ